ncbi:MAG: hypothetical protein ABMB14_09150 [Myxococcota bacterium]
MVEAPALPAPAPTPPAPVATTPPKAAALSGVYRGKDGGRPLAVTFRFQPDGALAGTVDRGGVAVDASGSYELSGDGASFVLMERGVAAPLVYAGTVSPQGVDGRMSESGRKLGKLELTK